MNKYSIVYLVLITGLLAIVSCDKIKNPYPEDISVVTPDTGIVWDDSNESVLNNGIRFILLEYFTGHQCKFCPPAATKAKELLITHSPQIISSTVHMGVFSEFDPDDSEFNTDFTTDLGNELEEIINPPSFPRGAFNRIPDGNFVAIGLSEWDNVLQRELGKAAIADITIKNRYDDSTGIIQSQVVLDWLTGFDPSRDYNLQMILVENKVVDWQKDIENNDEIKIPDYEHNHVLRTDINGLYGEIVTAPASSETKSDTLLKNFFLPSNVLDIKNCSVIAYLFNTGPDDYEIYQVNEAYITTQ